MNDAAPLAAKPSAPFLNVEGDLIVRIGNDAPSRFLSMITPGNGSSLLEELFKSAAGQPREPAKSDAPAIIIRDDAAPWKIMADGQRVDARESVTDHVALLFPDTGWMVGVDTLYRDAKKPFATHQGAEAAAKAIALLGYDDWSLASDKVYERHVIDRQFHKPAADTNLYPNLLLNDTYWTSRITPWSQDHAFYVVLYYGVVNNFPRYDSGFGLPARRARQ